MIHELSYAAWIILGADKPKVVNLWHVPQVARTALRICCIREHSDSLVGEQETKQQSKQGAQIRQVIREGKEIKVGLGEEDEAYLGAHLPKTLAPEVLRDTWIGYECRRKGQIMRWSKLAHYKRWEAMSKESVQVLDKAERVSQFSCVHWTIGDFTSTNKFSQAASPTSSHHVGPECCSMPHLD